MRWNSIASSNDSTHPLDSSICYFENTWPDNGKVTQYQYPVTRKLSSYLHLHRQYLSRNFATGMIKYQDPFEENFKLHFGTLPPKDSVTEINQLRKRIRLATSESNSAGLRIYELSFACPSTTRIRWNLPSGKMLVSQLTTRRLVQTFGLQLCKLVIQVANIQL